MTHTPSTTEHITIRGLRYGIRHWGNASAPKVFFLHGWMDTSATFQFVVDALKQSWHVIAPDWRGYGQSQWLSRPYWFPDYYADLHEGSLFDNVGPLRNRLEVTEFAFGLKDSDTNRIYMGPDFVGAGHPRQDHDDDHGGDPAGQGRL